LDGKILNKYHKKVLPENWNAYIITSMTKTKHLSLLPTQYRSISEPNCGAAWSFDNDKKGFCVDEGWDG
jgi:hypothetical protein